jgi:predicted metal-binding membrane protein
MAGTAARALVLDGRSRVRLLDVGIAGALLAGAVVGWWWSARMAGDMDSMGAAGSMTSMDSIGDAMEPISMAAYVGGWVAMIAAMMFPAISPVVRLYARAAANGAVAPLPIFVAGYVVVWGSVGIAAYFAWRELAGPLDEGAAWVGRLAGATLLAAAAYQLTPLKNVCLRHCRSPIASFLRFAGNGPRTSAAFRAGATHGAFCLGCCWALMAVLVAVGTMNIAWMAALTVVIFVEKLAPRGEMLTVLSAAAFAALGAVLLVDPSTITAVT